MSDAERRLAVYGTLAPGRPNHHQMAGLDGTWTPGHIYGHLHEEGWGAAAGYPGIVLDERGPRVEMVLFDSDDLPNAWARLDEFEGEGYQRVVVTAHLEDRVVEAYVYALAPSATPSCRPDAL